jgi:FeS assembly protein IscX
MATFSHYRTQEDVRMALTYHVERIVSLQMQLSWSHQADIAAALLKKYPETDRLSLGHDRLLKLILSLPEFKDSSTPPKPAYLDHILWTWMRLAGADFEGTG